MPRVFTALKIPQGISDQLAAFRGGLHGARWIDPENYHITLRFIGDISPKKASEIARHLGRIEKEPFSLKIKGLKVFGHNKLHSLVAEIAPNEALYALQKEQEWLCQRLGLEPDKRKFTPHITLARLRGQHDTTLASYLELRETILKGLIPIEGFYLLSARPFTGGGPYLEEAFYPLESFSHEGLWHEPFCYA